MNEDLLWYAARVSGLMTWVLAYGSLICSLLVRSQTGEVSSPSRLWAEDACRFFGFTSVLFAAAHGASIVMSSMFDVPAQSLLTLRDGQAWLGTGLLIGVVSSWTLVVANALRFLERRFARAAASLRTLLIAAVLIAGVYHGSSVGSDVRNYAAYAIIAVAGVMALVALGLAFGGTNRQPPPRRTPPPRRDQGDPPGKLLSPVSAGSSVRPARSSSLPTRTSSLQTRSRSVSTESSSTDDEIPEWTATEVSALETTPPQTAVSSRPQFELPELRLSRQVGDQNGENGQTDQTDQNGEGSKDAESSKDDESSKDGPASQELFAPEIGSARLIRGPGVEDDPETREAD